MSEQSGKNKKEELYLELKELDEEIKKLNSHLEKVDDQLSDLNTSKLAIAKLSELKRGDELRVPLTTGIYIKAILASNEKILVNVGAGVSVEKSPDEVLAILDGQMTELVSFRERLIENMKVMIARIEVIQKEFE